MRVGGANYELSCKYVIVIYGKRASSEYNLPCSTVKTMPGGSP